MPYTLGRISYSFTRSLFPHSSKRVHTLEDCSFATPLVLFLLTPPTESREEVCLGLYSPRSFS